MPTTVERIADRPILIVKFEGKVNIEQLKEIFARSEELTQDVDGIVYRISIIGEGANIGFADVISTVRASLSKMPGSSGDPRFRAVWVGKHQMAKLFADMLRSAPLGGVDMPFFNTYDEAMQYIETQIAVEQGQREQV